MAGGKLLRLNLQFGIEQQGNRNIIDSTGMYFTPSQRHFDRGSEVQDTGQFNCQQRVFGISGAAMMVCHDFYRDVSIAGEFFDEDFFAFREDADLSWRAQLLGWNCIYQPKAIGRHHRTVLPQRRRQLSRDINYHSVKNRFLMRIKNMDWGVRLRCFPWMWLRDMAIAAYIPLFERSSLGVLPEIRRLEGRMLKKRAEIQTRRRVGPRQIARWFSFRPASINV